MFNMLFLILFVAATVIIWGIIAFWRYSPFLIWSASLIVFRDTYLPPICTSFEACRPQFLPTPKDIGAHDTEHFNRVTGNKWLSHLIKINGIYGSEGYMLILKATFMLVAYPVLLYFGLFDVSDNSLFSSLDEYTRIMYYILFASMILPVILLGTANWYASTRFLNKGFDAEINVLHEAFVARFGVSILPMICLIQKHQDRLIDFLRSVQSSKMDQNINRVISAFNESMYQLNRRQFWRSPYTQLAREDDYRTIALRKKHDEMSLWLKVVFCVLILLLVATGLGSF